MPRFFGTLPAVTIAMISAVVAIAVAVPTATTLAADNQSGFTGEQWQTISSHLGVNVKPEKLNDEDLDRIKAMGFGIVRYDLRWREVEYQNGTYYWSYFDDFIARVRKRGLKSLIIVHGGNALYGGMVEMSNPAYDNRPAPAAPAGAEAQKAFVDFAKATVARYQKDDVVWEIWNEPDIASFWPPRPDAAAFSQLAIATCQGIREVAPHAIVTGPAFAHLPYAKNLEHVDFAKTALSPQLLDCMDAVSIHPYRAVDIPPETVLADYKDKVRPFIAELSSDSKRHNSQIVSSEWGYTGTRLSEEQQGAYAIRTHLSNLEAGLPISIWYEWRDSRQGDNDPEAHFGLLRLDGGDKPASRTVSDILPKIAAAKIEKVFAVEGNAACHAMLLRYPGNHLEVIAWLASKDVAARATLLLDVREKAEATRAHITSTPRLLDIGADGGDVKLSCME